MSPTDRWIERHLKRLAFGRFLERVADGLAAFLFVFGTAVLVVKLLLPAMWPHVLWLAAAAIPVGLTAWILSRRNRYTRTESVAMLDRRLRAGGLLMTLTETPDEQWAEQLPQVESVWQESIPRVRPVRFAKCVTLPLLFAAGACFVPLREARTEPILPNTVGKQASEQLEEMLDWLEDADVMADEEEKQLREEIDKLADQTEDTPLTHEKWETVDALRERMQMRLDTAALSTSKTREALAALAESASGDGPELSLDRTVQLEKNVRDALQKMVQDGAFSRASPGLQRELERLLKSGRFKLPTDPAERQKLLEDLGEFLDVEFDKLAELRTKCGNCKDGTCPFCGGKMQGGT